MELSRQDKNGDEVLRELSAMGLQNLYLATGYNDLAVDDKTPYKIQGKECPF